MAGEVKREFGPGVELEVIKPDATRFQDTSVPKAPNIAVDGYLLGKDVTIDEVRRVVSRRLEAGGERLH